ncbi:MAG: four helix bundle protein [Patescibacteria group bacterium]
MQNDTSKFKYEFKKRLYQWTLNLVSFVEHLPKGTSGDVMGKQLLRSGTSIIANYTEASAASSRRDFINFFTHSLKSANESKLWLALLRDTKQATESKATLLLAEITEIANILGPSILTLKKKKTI